MFSFLSRSFSSRTSDVEVELLIRLANIAGAATGDEFDEITCSSPELDGDTRGANADIAAIAGGTTVAAADTDGEIFRR